MSLAAAILTRARQAVPAVTVYDGKVPDGQVSGQPPERYAVLYLADPRMSAENVAHQSTGGHLSFQVTSVAPDREMASWLATRIRDALVDHRPQAAGWSPGLIEHTFTAEPRPDEQVQERDVILLVDRYQLLAERLPVELDDES